MSNRMCRCNSLLHDADGDDNPMGMLTNLFDVAMVFAVALMVAIVMHFNMSEIFSTEDYTMVKNPGEDNMEIVTKKGDKMERYTPSETQNGAGNRGRRVGSAYQLESGEVIYVPE